MEKAEDVYDYSFKKDAEVKGYEDDGQHVMHGVDFFQM